MSNFCDLCGCLHEFCLCDGNPDSTISQDKRERQRLEDYQDNNQLTNDEMTDFVNDS